MILNGRTPIKVDKIFDKDGNYLSLNLLNPGDTIRCSFLLEGWTQRNRISTVCGRNKKLSDLLTGKDRLRVDFALYLQYKIGGSNGGIESDKTNKVNVVRSEIISIWTQSTDRNYIVEITVPEYDYDSFFDLNRISKISLYLLISLDSRLMEDEVNIFDTLIETKEIKFSKEFGSINGVNSVNDVNNVINFFQTTNRLSGYGMMGDGLVREINSRRNNIDTDKAWLIRDFCRDGKGRINDSEMAGLKSKITLILHVPTMWFKAKNSKYTIGYSMFECTRIPSTWISGCNKVDRIFVPVINNIEGFRLSGVSKNIPIDVIPIGIDSNTYDPSKYTDKEFEFDFESEIEKDTYKFLVVNDNQSRKNNGTLIKAIGEEFEEEINKNKVVLITRFCHGKKLIKNKFVHHIRRYLKDEDMAKLIFSCNCMVNISSGENGDIPILQGMAMEKPVIISEDKLVHSEIIDEGIKMFGESGVAFSVKIDEWERAYSGNEYIKQKYFEGLGKDAKWVIPDYYDLRKKLRYVYDNRDNDDVREVGKNAREYILENRTVNVAVDKMLDIFDKLK